MIDMTGHPLGILALGVFVGAYIFVILEELLDLRKSKPVVLAAGMIWAPGELHQLMVHVDDLVEAGAEQIPATPSRGVRVASCESSGVAHAD